MKKILLFSLLIVVVPQFVLGYTSSSNSSSPRVDVSKSLVASGDFVTLDFYMPSDTVMASLFIYCPAGVQVLTEGGFATGLDFCNQEIGHDLNLRSQKFKVLNANNFSQGVVPNFRVYKKQNPNYSYGVSGSFQVGSAKDSFEISKSDKAVIEIKAGSKPSKSIINPGNDVVLAEFKIKSKKSNSLLSMLSLKDRTGALYNNLNNLELYNGKTKISFVETSVLSDTQVNFNFKSPVTIQKNKTITITVKGDVPTYLSGQDIAFSVVGIGAGAPSTTFKGNGATSKVLSVK